MVRVGQPPQSRLMCALQFISQCPVRPRSRHHGKVPHLPSNFQPAGRDRDPLSADLHFDGLFRIERNAQMPRQSVRAPQRNNAQGRTRISIIGNQALKHLVHSPVAAASEHNLRPVTHCIACLIGGRLGPRRGDHQRLMSQRTQPRGRTVNLGDSPLPPRSRRRIADEHATHPLILGGTLAPPQLPPAPFI